MHVTKLDPSIHKNGHSMFDKHLVFPDEPIHGTFENTCAKCPVVTPGYANAQPPGRDKIANASPPGLSSWANVLRLPGGGGRTGHCWNWLMHYIRKEFNYNPYKIGPGHQHGHRYIVLGYPYGRCDVMWKHLTAAYLEFICVLIHVIEIEVATTKVENTFVTRWTIFVLFDHFLCLKNKLVKFQQKTLHSNRLTLFLGHTKLLVLRVWTLLRDAEF